MTHETRCFHALGVMIKVWEYRLVTTINVKKELLIDDDDDGPIRNHSDWQKVRSEWHTELDISPVTITNDW